jgi:hypothetical protein
VRNALILLVVVALVIVAVGALNNGTAFEIDYVAGTMSEVSLLWVSLVIAAIVFVAGLAAAWFALSGAAGGRRKLEAELQSTYERLRETEREAAEAKASVAAATAAAAAAAEQAAPDIFVATVVAEREEPTVVVAEAVTMVIEEPETVVAAGVPDGEAGAGSPAEADEAPEEAMDVEPAGEQTAVTMVAPPEQPAEAPESVDTEVSAEAPDETPADAGTPDDGSPAADGPQGDAPAEAAGDARQ